MHKAMLIDPSKCIGCRACQVACKQWNQLPAEETSFTGSYENPPAISAVTWTKIMFRECEENDRLQWFFCKQGCMHCSDAACMTVCPSGAIYHTDEGTVKVDTTRCIGCNYCAASCPFQAVSFDRRTNLPPKCTFCHDRVVNGLKPACATACPTGAISYGDRPDIIRLGYQRVDKLKSEGRNNAQIYGLDEVGGTGMVYVLTSSPELYGLPLDPHVPFTARLWGALFKPLRALVLIAIGFGLLANRSQSREMQKSLEAAREKEPPMDGEGTK